MKYHLLVLLSLLSSFSFGQNRVENPYSPDRQRGANSVEINALPANIDSAVAALIIGGCVEISNFQIHGPSDAFGVFLDPTEAIGMSAGVVITNGEAMIAEGPDDDDNAGNNQGVGGHQDLTQIAGITTFDATWIEFDFTPLADTLFASDFVFGSEEYPEWVNAGYNDVFGFFISGPGIAGPFSNGAENIAWVPGTTTPVAIDNVNNGQSGSGPCTNCQYYVDNSGGPYLQYDGYTEVISLEYPVTAGETYHFMIAIADAGDGIYDSGVLIQSESFCGNTWFQESEFAAQQIANLEYQFQNYSSRSDSYIWQFGDGDVSIEENPTHVFDSPGEYAVSLTCTNACFDTTTTVLLNVGMVTGVEEQIEIESSVTNVGLDAVRVQCELGLSANVKLSIVDMVGRTVWSETIGTTNRFTKNVNVSAFKKGIYLMQIDAGKSTSIERFVKF